MKKRKWQIGIGILLLAAIVGMMLSYHQGGQNRYEAQFLDLFDTETTIIGYSKSQNEFDNHIELLREKMRFYNELFDIYNCYDGVNNVKTINDSAGIQAVQVDPEIIALLREGIALYEQTDGQVNIAYGSVLRVWHDYREAAYDDPENAALPPMELLAERAEHTNIEDIIIDEEASTVYLADPEMSLDVGSIGKGYAVQKLGEYARELGMDHLLINAGGNICTIGTKADGTPWTAGIQNPDLESEETYIAAVSVQDQCVVTSGDYQRYYEVDGKKYCHIIDPDTNMPAEYFASVTLIAKDSGVSDALATAIFNMDYEEGKTFVEALGDGTEVMWILKDGTVRYTDGFRKYMTE